MSPYCRKCIELQMKTHRKMNWWRMKATGTTKSIIAFLNCFQDKFKINFSTINFPLTNFDNFPLSLSPWQHFNKLNPYARSCIGIITIIMLNTPSISDYEFDMNLKNYKLWKLNILSFRSLSPTQRVGSDINTAFQQVEHQYPMLSLENTYSKVRCKIFIIA